MPWQHKGWKIQKKKNLAKNKSMNIKVYVHYFFNVFYLKSFQKLQKKLVISSQYLFFLKVFKFLYFSPVIHCWSKWWKICFKILNFMLSWAVYYKTRNSRTCSTHGTAEHQGIIESRTLTKQRNTQNSGGTPAEQSEIPMEHQWNTPEQWNHTK